MLGLLTPERYIKSFDMLQPGQLHDLGMKGLLVDLDNTITPWRYGEPDDRLAGWVDGLLTGGIGVCIVSNNVTSRVNEFGDALGIPVVPAAVKPRRRAFRRGMDLLGTGPGETAVLGDQIFTDILGGNRLGLYTILVVPMSQREMVWTRMVRFAERRVLGALARRGLLKGPEDAGRGGPAGGAGEDGGSSR